MLLRLWNHLNDWTERNDIETTRSEPNEWENGENIEEIGHWSERNKSQQLHEKSILPLNQTNSDQYTNIKREKRTIKYEIWIHFFMNLTNAFMMIENVCLKNIEKCGIINQFLKNDQSQLRFLVKENRQNNVFNKYLTVVGRRSAKTFKIRTIGSLLGTCAGHRDSHLGEICTFWSNYTPIIGYVEFRIKTFMIHEAFHESWKASKNVQIKNPTFYAQQPQLAVVDIRKTLFPLTPEEKFIVKFKSEIIEIFVDGRWNGQIQIWNAPMEWLSWTMRSTVDKCEGSSIKSQFEPNAMVWEKVV